MDLRLPTCPSVIPSPEGTPMEPPKVRRESGQVGAYTEHSSRTSTSNDPWLLSQPLEVLQVTRKRTESTSQSSAEALQDFFSIVRVTHTQKSQVVYFKVMDAKADSKDSVITPLDSLLDDISNYLQSIPKENFSQLFNQ